MALNGLSGVPDGFSHKLGGVFGEPYLHLIGLDSHDDAGVSEVILKIKVSGNLGGGVQGTKGLEPGDPVGLRRQELTDLLPDTRLVNSDKSIWMEV